MREYNGRLRSSTRKISTRILIPNFSWESRACANRLSFFLPRKKWPRNALGAAGAIYRQRARTVSVGGERAQWSRILQTKQQRDYYHSLLRVESAGRAHSVCANCRALQRSAEALGF